MNKFFYILLFIVSSNMFSQEKATIVAADKAFALIFSNPKQAKIDLDKLEIQVKEQKDSLYSIILNSKGVYYAVQTQMDSALIYFYKSSSAANKTSKRYLGTQTNIAVILKKTGEIDAAIQLLETTLAIANQKRYNTTRATIYGELASCYSAKEWYKQSLENLLQSIEIWGNENPTPIQKIAIEKQKLGNLYLKVANAPQALKIFNEISPVFKKIGDLHNFYLVQITVADINLDSNNPKKALQLIQNALPSLEIFNDKELLLYAYKREAKSMEALGNTKVARQKYALAITFGLKYNQIETVSTLTNYGSLMLKLKDSSGLQKLKRQTESPVFTQLLKLNATTDQIQYYLWLEKFAQLNKDIAAESASKERLENLKFLQSNKNNFQQVNMPNNLQTDNRIIVKEASNKYIGAVIVAIILLIALIAFLLFTKYKNKNAFSKISSEKLQKEKERKSQLDEVQKIVAHTVESNIQTKEKELFAQTLKLKLQPLLTRESIDINNTIQEQERDIEKIKININDLISEFENINPEFVTALQKKYPVLTKKERHFCYLLKLNFSNKVIAQLTHINVQSVISKKYRIVKKLHLPKEIDFYELLKNIS